MHINVQMHIFRCICLSLNDTSRASLPFSDHLSYISIAYLFSVVSFTLTFSQTLFFVTLLNFIPSFVLFLYTSLLSSFNMLFSLFFFYDIQFNACAHIHTNMRPHMPGVIYQSIIPTLYSIDNSVSIKSFCNFAITPISFHSVLLRPWVLATLRWRLRTKP